MDPFKIGKIPIRQYLVANQKNKALNTTLEHMLSTIGCKRDAMMTFEEFLRFMLPAAK